MIGNLSYEDVQMYSASLLASSTEIRKIVEKYGELEEINEFCNVVDTYSKFLENSITLYKDSEEALKEIIEKSK